MESCPEWWIEVAWAGWVKGYGASMGGWGPSSLAQNSSVVKWSEVKELVGWGQEG